MRRFLVSTGVALIDAGTAPDVARWLVELLGSVPRTYLPRAEVEVESECTIVRFRAGDRGLLLAVVRPGFACWSRLKSDGSRDGGRLSEEPVEEVARLFDWLVDGVVAGV
jgi:hypothetical protein